MNVCFCACVCMRAFVWMQVVAVAESVNEFDDVMDDCCPSDECKYVYVYAHTYIYVFIYAYLCAQQVVAVPESINELDDVTDDCRTSDKLVDGVTDTWDATHM